MIISRDGRGMWKHFCTTISKSEDPLNGLSTGEDIIGAYQDKYKTFDFPSLSNVLFVFIIW